MMHTLSCCYGSLPGAGPREKVDVAAALGLAMDVEFVSRQALQPVADRAREAGVSCPAVLAHGCHGLQPLSDPAHRERFAAHVLEAGRGARLLGSALVVTAVYEKRAVEGARVAAEEIYRGLSRELPGLGLLIECLEGSRTAFLPDVAGMAAFVAGMRLPGAGLVVDTWHASRSERDLCGTLRRHAREIRIVHLRDTGSRLPGLGDLDFDHVFGSLREGGFRGGFTVECSPPASRAVFERAVRGLKERMRRHFPH